jgi:hypothetical protein
MGKPENLVIFMSDSIRWDYHPEEIASKGLTVKTIAGSLHTPTSIATMLTGYHLPGHGVHGFTDVLNPDFSTILDYFTNVGLSAVEGKFNDPQQGAYFNETIYKILLSRYDSVSLSDIEKPFAWFMRDPGAHAPQGNWTEDMVAKMSVQDYYQKYGGKQKKLKSNYQNAIEDSVDRFDRYVIRPLRDRNLLEDTLIVFISDHGEWLGEYGHAGASFPAGPSLVYVPTTFIHPNVSDEDEIKLFRHIDLPRTIAELLDKNIHQTSGVDALANPPTYGCNFYSRSYPSFRGYFQYEINSVWDQEGGHVFNRSGNWDNMKLITGYMFKMAIGKHFRRSFNIDGLKLLLEDHRTWDTPSITMDEAASTLASIKNDSHGNNQTEPDLDNEIETHLRNLGYL